MTKYSIKKPFTVLVGVIMVLVLGVVSFFELNTDLLPAMDLPYVVVYTVYPGASPERVEVAVTQPLEQAVATTSGLENIQSISSENLSLIIMEFSGSTNMDSAMIELSNNIDMVAGYLDDMVQSPTLMKINPDMLPVQMLSVDVDGMDIKQLSEYVETDLGPRLERLDGVATVDVSGLVRDHVDIFLNQDKIDDINDSILKAVDRELYETKKDLDKAQSELRDGQKELEDREEEAYEKMADASAELDAGQAQLILIAGEADKIAADIGLYEAQIQMLTTLGDLSGQLAGLNGQIAGMESQLADIQRALTTLETLQQLLAAEGYDDTPFADIIAEGTSALVPQLQGMIDAGEVKGTDTVNGLVSATKSGADALKAGIEQAKAGRAQMEAGIQALKDELLAMGVEQSVIDAATADAVRAIQAKIDGKSQELKQAEYLKKQMEETVNKLKKTYSQLEAAKMQATAELAAANVQIDSAEKQLESGIEQFEDARDRALKQANIDSLVTQDMLKNILAAQNFSMPAGYITDGSNELTVKVGETFATLEELENLLLVDMGLDGVKPVYLKDVADLEINDNKGDSYVRINGNPSVSISIQKSSTASTSRVSDLVNEEVAEIMEENPSVHVTQLMDQGMFIDMVVNSVISNMGYGFIIAILVLIMFLGDWRPTLVIGLSIPLSVLFAIVMMYFTGVNLNVMSLSGLALGIGMLVDNSIVVIENVYRLRSLGNSRVKSAVIGAQQVAGAIASSTLTTICVFLPIVFTDGLARQLFFDMGLTIGFSLVASLVVALTVVPALASVVLTRTKEPKTNISDRISALYEKALAVCLDHKRAVILFCVAMLVFSGWYATRMPMTLIPAMDSTQMQMTLSMPVETTDEELIEHAEAIAEKVQAMEDVQTVGITIGGGGISAIMGGGEETKNASFYVVLSEDKKLSNEEIAEAIEAATPEYKETLTVTANTMDLGALAGSGISVQIKGNDLDTLQQQAANVGEILLGVEGVAEVDDGSSDAVEEVRIEVNKKKAMEKGLTVAQVFQKVSAALTEKTTATTLTFAGEEMDAVIHAATTYTRDDIGRLVVTTETDDDGNEKNIRLADIADIGTGTTPDSIARDNQSRYVTVSARLEKGYNATLVAREVEKLLEDYEMPKGYSYAMTGEDEAVMTAMIDMIKMIALAIVFIYLIMVSQFQSLRSPFIVMFTIPLAFTGGLLALMITGEELSIVAMIGFLVLAGVVVNNGIVFVDYVNQLRIGGMDKRTALIQTGKDRLRPILMTALTTILANSTMAMGVGMGAELSQGMAMVTIGGLSYATLLTLFLVPSLYDIFNKKPLKVIDVDFEDEGL